MYRIFYVHASVTPYVQRFFHKLFDRLIRLVGSVVAWKINIIENVLIEMEEKKKNTSVRIDVYTNSSIYRYRYQKKKTRHQYSVVPCQM